MMEYHDASHRMLRSFGSGPKTDGGPLAVLIVVVGLIFFIWIPMLFRRHCRRGSTRCYGRGGEQQRQQAGENITEIVRISLENLRMLSLNETLSNTRCSPSILWNPIRSMNPEDRKDYISNVLVSRKILNVFKEESPTSSEDGGLCQGDSSTRKSSCRKSALLLADVVDVESTTKVVNVEPCCIICLNDYVEGDILCWSQSPKCQHYMHKDCASEWLMNHEECPLCRHNYLSLDDENEADENGLEDHAEGNRRITADEMVGGNGGEEEAISVVSGGIPLFYALSHLQNLADARPNTTFRLEGIELVDGQRGIVEVQRSTGGGGRSSTSNGGMGFRVRRLGNGNVGGTTDRQHAVNAAPSSSTFAVQQVIYSGSSSSATGSSGTEGDSREDTPRHSPTPSSLPRQEGETSEIWSKAAAQEVHSITNQK